MADDSTAGPSGSRPTWHLPEGLDAQARVLLAIHRLDVETHRCVECGDAAPCQAANEAVGVLRDLGVSLVEPAGSGRQPAASSAGGLRRWLW